MSIDTTREQRRQLIRDNEAQPRVLRPIPRAEWPANNPAGMIEAWRSRYWLVQVFNLDEHGAQRVSVNRPIMGPDGRWADGITWDDLMEVKRQIGRHDRWAVEIFPPDQHIVNVANLRHFWLLDAPPAFAWMRNP